MPYGERVINASGDRAEGDKEFAQAVFNGVSGTLSIGMPLFADLTDSAEFNSKLAQTALVTTPPTPRTGKRVVLATSANTNVNALVGLYAPENPGDRPNQGDIVRICIFGPAVASAISKTGNTFAAAIGSLLGIDATQASAATIGGTAVARQTIGVITATGTALTNGATPTGGAAGANAALLVNVFVSPS